MSDTALQKTIDYACGTGADCSPIHKKGGCFEPDTVRAHCSYAANSYFQKKGQSNGTCDFSGTATLTNTDPSMHLLLLCHPIQGMKMATKYGSLFQVIIHALILHLSGM